MRQVAIAQLEVVHALAGDLRHLVQGAQGPLGAAAKYLQVADVQLVDGVKPGVVGFLVLHRVGGNAAQVDRGDARAQDYPGFGGVDRDGALDPFEEGGGVAAFGFPGHGGSGQVAQPGRAVALLQADRAHRHGLYLCGRHGIKHKHSLDLVQVLELLHEIDHAPHGPVLLAVAHEEDNSAVVLLGGEDAGQLQGCSHTGGVVAGALVDKGRDVVVGGDHDDLVGEAGTPAHGVDVLLPLHHFILDILGKLLRVDRQTQGLKLLPQPERGGLPVGMVDIPLRVAGDQFLNAGKSRIPIKERFRLRYIGFGQRALQEEEPGRDNQESK